MNNNAVINQNSLETKNNNIKKEIEELQKHLKINNIKVVTATDIYVGATSTNDATAGLIPAATSEQ